MIGPETAVRRIARRVPLARRVPSDAAALRGGWRIVAGKELTDQLLSLRFVILLALLVLTAAAAVYAAAGSLRDVAQQASEAREVFLALFTVSGETVPSFTSLVAFLVPLLGIGLAFDAINGERAQRTLPRLLSHPIHRDDVINGKFAAGLGIVAFGLALLTLVVAGVGIWRLGVVPTADEVGRLLIWLALTVLYVGFWFGVATLCSVAFRRAATSALVVLGVWLALTLFGTILAGILADAIRPVPDEPTLNERLSNARLELALERISPSRLYEEATIALLNPEVRSLGLLLPAQVDRAVRSSLDLEQSLLLAWPQIVGIVGLAVVAFAVAYVLFMRQEVRA